MRNFDRALEVLEAARRPGELRIHPNDAVEALAKAGLITPDPPKEDVVSANGTPVWRPDKGLMVTAFRDGEVRMGIPPTYPDTEFREVIYTQPQAIEQALALLAAAKHKEGEE